MASFTRRDANPRPPRARHGHAPEGAPSPEYVTWMGMKARCSNPHARNYRWYGAKGVTVCERWRDSFALFFQDMGPKPTAKHSLDRIDPAGNYEPGNCRWATWEQQCKNKRPNRKPTSAFGEASTSSKLTTAAVLSIRARRADGESLKVLAREFGMCESTISLAARGKNWGRLNG